MNVGIEVAERLHIEVGDQVHDALHAVEQRRHDDHRPGRGGHGVELDTRQPARRDQIADQPLQQLDDQLAGRHRHEERDQHERRAAPPLPPGVREGGPDEQGGARRNRAEIARRGPGEEEASQLLLDVGAPRDAALELPPSGPDEVIADVRGARVGRAHVDLPCALDALQREQQLPVPAGHRQFLDGVAIPVAAAEVHPAVDARGIALEHLFDEAHVLEELAPVERRDQAETADQVGHPGLFNRLVLAFRADGVLDRLSSRLQGLLELLVQPRGDRAVRARALQQARHERMMHLRRPRGSRARRRFNAVRHAVRVQPVGAGGGQHVAARAQVIDQRQLQRAGPRPELAHRERRHRLERADESLEPLRIEPARARSDQLERERVDAGQPRELVGGDAGQASEKGGGEVVLDVARGGGNDVEVVEQPFRGGRHGLPAVVLRERRVDVAERPDVLFELPQVGAPAARASRGRDGEQRRQPPRVLIQQFDAEQLDVAARRTKSRHCRPRHALGPGRHRRRQLCYAATHKTWYIGGTPGRSGRWSLRCLIRRF